MLTLLLFLFYQFSHSEEQCPVKKISGLAKFAEALSKPSNSIGNKLYSSFFDEEEEDGYEGEDEDEGIDLFSMDRIFGPIVFAGFIIFFFIILLFWTCCSQCCACCSCYRPKTAGKPSICLIVVFSISAAFFLFSTIVLYCSGSKISKAFNELVDLPQDFNNSYNNFVGKITDIVYDTFDSANTTLVQILYEVESFINMIDDNADEQKEKAEKSELLINDYVHKFDNRYTNTDFYQLYDKYGNKGELDRCVQDVLDITAPNVIAVARKMSSNTDQLKLASAQLESQLINIKDIESDLQTGREDVNSIVGDLNSMNEVIDEFANNTDLAADYKSLVGTLVYVIPTYCLLFLVAYILSFIFKCCCSKCLLAWFHCLAFFVCFFVIFLGAIFAFLFSLFNNFCPEIVDFITDNIELEDISKENLTQIFVCDQQKSIMDLGFDQVINLNESLSKFDEVPELIENATKLDNIEIIQQNFDNFTDGLDLNESITGNKIILNYKTTLPLLKTESNQPGIIGDIIDLIDKSENELKEAKELMNEVTSFATQIMPSINRTRDKATNLTNTARDSFQNVNKRLYDINCMDSRCIYSSIYTPMCYSITTGAGLWAVSAITTIISVILMSCSICKRRKQFKTASIQPAEEFEGPDQDLAGFTANDDLLL